MSLAQLRSLLSRHGWNSTSFQVLDAGFAYWFVDDEAACVAYYPTPAAWVAAGAPIAAVASVAHVTDRFVEAARAARRRVCFFAVERRFLQSTQLAHLQIGEQPVWDPNGWRDTVAQHRSLREQLRRARARGVRVRAVEPCEVSEGSPLRRAIEAVIGRWQAAHPMAPMGFLVHVQPFTFADDRLLFVAECDSGRDDGDVVGALSIVPVYARNGWLFKDLLRDPRAPNGTAELLIAAAMEDVAKRGSRYVTLGLAPLAGAVSPWLVGARRLVRGLYDFRGLHTFKAKLRPQAWEPIYLAYPPEQNLWLTIYDVLRAFAPHGLWRFSWDTLRRGPSVLVRLLTLLLVPWTVVLACIDGQRWFPAPWVQPFWVTFDIALLAGLAMLNRRWNHTLATVLATAVTLDAAVTGVEALCYELPHAPFAAAVKTVAVAAPSLAAWVLWSARRQRRLWLRS